MKWKFAAVFFVVIFAITMYRPIVALADRGPASEGKGSGSGDKGGGKSK